MNYLLAVFVHSYISAALVSGPNISKLKSRQEMVKEMA